MKKFIASASIIAVGAAGLYGDTAPGLTRTQTSKPWSVSASLRGFYDDNYATAPSSSDLKRDSFGFEVSPKASINMPWQQSYLGASYQYSLKYYEDREDHKYDQTHDFKLRADHRFNQQYSVYLDDSFIITEEPGLLDPGQAPLRSNADGMRNHARIGFDAGVTELIGFAFGYYNGYYNYDDSGPASRSAQLDRWEHLLNIDARYNLRPDLAALIGYQFGLISYTADEYLYLDPGSTEKSDIRDNTAHYGYVGMDGDITSNLRATLKVGVQYTDFSDLGETSTTPYANFALTYTYLPGSYLQLGAIHRRNAVDQAGSPGEVVTDQASTSLYGQVSHRITAKLTGNLLVQGQFSEFQNGLWDGDTENWLLVGANLDYQLTQYLATEVGYNFDRLDSDLPDRSFTRNRVYLGVRASY
jgi:hypothetical protein